MPKIIAINLGNIYEKYYAFQNNFLPLPCLTEACDCDIIINIMDNCIAKSVHIRGNKL